MAGKCWKIFQKKPRVANCLFLSRFGSKSCPICLNKPLDVLCFFFGVCETTCRFTHSPFCHFVLDGFLEIVYVIFQLERFFCVCVLNISIEMYCIHVFTCSSNLFIFKIYFSPGLCGSVDWALAWEPEGFWLNFQSGHMPGLQARSPVGGTWEATTQWCFSPSVSPSFTLSLKINK